MKIKNITLRTPFILTPMAGFTDCGFRSLCADFDAGLTTTEMVSARGLLFGGDGSKSLLYFEENSNPKSVQIFSNEPDVVAEILKRGLLKDFDIVDINMGCPMPKIVKEGMGSALLLDFDKASNVIKSAVNNTSQPVTVKFRIGFTQDTICATDFAKMCEDSGASAICVHGRTKTQLYSGLADWSVIENVVDSVKIPVFGNGDVQNILEAKEKMENFGCAGIGIGRASLGKPWIFSGLSENEFDIPAIIKKHFTILEKYFSEKLVLLHMRKHLACYIHSFPKAKQYRQKIVTSFDKQEIFDLIDELFKK